MNESVKSRLLLQQTDITSSVREIRVVNLADGIISCRVAADSYILTELQKKALSEWSQKIKNSGNAQIGIKSVTVGGGGSKETSEAYKEANEAFKSFAVNLIAAGYQDVVPGNMIKISIQTPSKLNYISIIQNGVEIRNQWSTTDIEIVVSLNGSISSSPTYTVSNTIPFPSSDKASLYRPIYQEYVKKCLAAFQGLYIVYQKHKQLLRREVIKNTIQRSVEFRSANLAVMILLKIVKNNWLGTTVKLLYDSNKKPEIFAKDYEINKKLLSRISADALELSASFNIAMKWYYNLQGFIKNIQTSIYVDVGSNFDNMIKVLKNIMDKGGITDIDLVTKLYNLGRMKSDTKQEVSVKVNALSDFRILLDRKLQIRLIDATEEIEKAKLQMQLSSISFVGGPWVGAAVTGGFGIAYEIKKHKYNKLRDAVESAMEESSKQSQLDSVIKHIGKLANDIGELAKFCAIMSYWFKDQASNFKTWGIKNKQTVQKIDKSFMKWSIDDFLNWLKNSAKGSSIYNKYHEIIRQKLSAVPNWTGAKLADKNYFKSPISIYNKFGVKDEDDANNLYNIIKERISGLSKNNIPIDYVFWQKTYNNDLKFLDNSAKDCGKMIELLTKLNTDFAIKASEADLKPYIPKYEDYPQIVFQGTTISVQAESKQVM